MALRIYRSNRLDTLVTLLCEVVSQPLSHPFAKETIVVSSLGMERWIVSELSRRFGVWTNAEHPLPRAFVEHLLRTRDLEPCKFDAWDREHLALTIAEWLSNDSRIAPFPLLHAYVQGDTRPERSLELAKQIADAFDQYLVYRPDWIRAWETGADVADDEDWQPGFFRELVKELGPRHFAHRLQTTLQELESEHPILDGFPERLCCFQVGLLPPSYLQLIRALGQHLPVHLFVLSPSRAYVEYARSQRLGSPSTAKSDGLRDAVALSKTDARPTKHEAYTKQLAFAFGNADTQEDGARVMAQCHRKSGSASHSQQPLLSPSSLATNNEPWESQPLFASLCRQARQLESILGELGPVEIGAEHFVEPDPRTLLELLQSDLVALRHRPSTPYRISADDRSISIHACHSRRREIECLREVLLDNFDRDPSLSPEDVLVMLADINEYAPLVNAIFGARHGSVGHIPFTVADRPAIAYNGLADSLLRLLDLFAERLTFSRFMDIVSLERLQSKFGISPDKLSVIERWLGQLRFTWGIDASDRKAADAPETEEHSLRFGLSRLLLGVALDSREAPVFNGRAPLDVEGEEAELAGRLAELCETCFDYRAKLMQGQTIDAHCALITALLDDVFSIDRDNLWQRTEIRDRLHELAQVAREAKFAQKISFYSLRQELKSRLDAVGSARSFLSGGVTFCKMLPLRSIPFRAIAMVGLDDDQFPRRERRSSFNALQREHRVGDRSVSDEDRYLFAETLVACRERLIITYKGRSSRDDSALPPSVVVEDLLNTIEESCTAPSAPSVREHIVHVEALQPFSPRYFDGSRPDLVNRSDAHFRAAMALRSERQPRQTPDYSSNALAPIERLHWTELVKMLRDPSRAYLESVLHVASDLEYEQRDGIEPVVLDALTQWQVTRKILSARQRGDSESTIRQHLRATGDLPVLGLGDVALDTLSERAESLFTAAAPYCRGEPLPLPWISLDIADVCIEGAIDSTWPTAHLSLSPSRFSPRKATEAWLEHLCLNASGVHVRTAIVTRSEDGSGVEARELDPMSEDRAKHYLEQFVQDYRWSRALPLPFFLEPGYEYQRARNRQRTHEQALEAAYEKLEKKRESGDLPSQFESLFGFNPLDDDWPNRARVPHILPFALQASRWLGPLFEHLNRSDTENADSEREVIR